MTLSTEAMRLYQRERRAKLKPKHKCKECLSLELEISKLKEQLEHMTKCHLSPQ